MKTSTPIRKILLVGGTHGNEKTGIFLIEKWQKFPHKIQRDNLQIDVLLANPKAIQANRRYLDYDLNRCFSRQVLSDPTRVGEEFDRAHELVTQIGDKGQCQYDLIIDMHTTTANMGVNLVLTTHDDFHWSMMAYMQNVRDDVTVTSEAEMIPDHHFLCALAKHNLIVEVGPVAQGILEHQTMDKTEQTIHALLDYVQAWNRGCLTELPDELEILEYTGKVYLPQDENGNIVGFIHQNIQGRDFQMIRSGDPVFRTMEDRDVVYQGEDTYISFVNEAAYYDKKLAFCTLRKTQINRRNMNQ